MCIQNGKNKQARTKPEFAPSILVRMIMLALVKELEGETISGNLLESLILLQLLQKAKCHKTHHKCIFELLLLKSGCIV